MKPWFEKIEQVLLKVSRSLGVEGKTLAQLDHPHIAAVYSEQTISGRTLLAMRYVPGKTLADWMSAVSEKTGRRPFVSEIHGGSLQLQWMYNPSRCPKASVLRVAIH